MTANPLLRTTLRRLLLQPANGVVGIGDDLLSLSEVHELHLDWHSENGHVRVFGDGGETLLEEPYRRSVFRAILARVAALCKERGASAVSPYGGQAELTVGQSGEEVLRVTFVNTPESQKLDLCWRQPALRSTYGSAEQTQIGPAVS
jgi:hypothetical protein